MIMPFGKYEGHEVDDLPLGYLNWLVDNIVFNDAELEDEVWAVIESRHVHRDERLRREREAAQIVRVTQSCPSPGLWAEVVKAGMRSIQKKYHPDLGGDHDDMIQVNAIREWINEYVSVFDYP